MRISEIIKFDAEEKAVEALRQNAKRARQKAAEAAARLKAKKAQHQVVKATQTINTTSVK